MEILVGTLGFGAGLATVQAAAWACGLVYRSARRRARQHARHAGFVGTK